MKNKIICISLVLFIAVFLPTVFVSAENTEKENKTAVSAEENLPNPGMLPDSGFYFLKTWKESIRTFFTFGAENKARQYLHLAEVRLAEYQKMVEKDTLRQAQGKKLEIAERTIEKYEKQLNRALEKTEEAKEKGKDVEKLKEEISEKILKHQEVIARVLEKAPEESARLKARLEALKEKLPETTSGDIDKVESETQQEESALSETSTTTRTTTDYGQGQTSPKPIVQPKSIQPTQPKPISSPSMNTSLPWATGTFQAEFPSFFLTGQPIMMRSPDLPMPQPVAEQRPVLQSMSDDQWCAKKRMRIDDHGVKYILEMLGVVTVKVGSVDCRACYVRKFSENGVLAAERWDDMYFWYLQKLSGKWACEKSINYKNFIGSEWTDYYHISESWSPQNFYYQCVKREGAYVSGNADYCEKDVPLAATPTPAPIQTTIACYIGEICRMGSREECSAKGGKAVDESSCPAAPGDVSCQRGIMEDYKCPNGSLIKWQCKCGYLESTGDERRSCTVKPAESCSLSISSPSLTINSIGTRYNTWQQGAPGAAKSISMQIFWTINKPTTSWIEYGLTTAYGSKVSSYGTPDYDEHGIYDLPSMQHNTTYHFRIVAEDANGNKIVSDDYTFTTGL